ncbi:GNAT family N-acetyltransferase [Actinokineospora sp.]|uniref:GNAT family N-acetyltransferase n=1 Tax=Actinokineospora sp. TaxID=1872133 RepID=UPI0040377B79
MRGLTIRHFTPADVPLRTALLREPHCLENIGDWPLLTDHGEIVARQHAAIAHRQASLRLFCVCRGTGEVIGFVWMTDIDWRSQTCQFSIVLVERYRGGFGTPAVITAREYLHNELNMRVVVNRVFEHNTMLNSRGQLTASRQVTCPYDGYTVGEFRTQSAWVQTVDDFRASVAELPQRRAELRARIQSRAAEVIG